MTLEVPRLQDIAGDAVSNLYKSTIGDDSLRVETTMKVHFERVRTGFLKDQRQIIQDFLTNTYGFKLCVAQSMAKFFTGCEEYTIESPEEFDLEHCYFRLEKTNNRKPSDYYWYQLKRGLYIICAPPTRNYGIVGRPDLSNSTHISEVLMFANGVPISTEKTELASRVTALLFPPALRRSKRNRSRD